MSARKLTPESPTDGQQPASTRMSVRTEPGAQPMMDVLRDIDSTEAAYFWRNDPQRPRPIDLWSPAQASLYPQGCGLLTVEGFRTTCAEEWSVPAADVEIEGCVDEDESCGHLVARRPEGDGRSFDEIAKDLPDNVFLTLGGRIVGRDRERALFWGTRVQTDRLESIYALHPGFGSRSLPPPYQVGEACELAEAWRREAARLWKVPVDAVELMGVTDDGGSMGHFFALLEDGAPNAERVDQVEVAASAAAWLHGSFEKVPELWSKPDPYEEIPAGKGGESVEAFRCELAEKWGCDMQRVKIRGWREGPKEGDALHVLAELEIYELRRFHDEAIFGIVSPETHRKAAILWWGVEGRDEIPPYQETTPTTAFIEHLGVEPDDEFPESVRVQSFFNEAAERWNVDPEMIIVYGCVAEDQTAGWIELELGLHIEEEFRGDEAAYWMTADYLSSCPADLFRLPAGAVEYNWQSRSESIVRVIEDWAMKWDCHPRSIQARGAAIRVDGRITNLHLVGRRIRKEGC